MFSRKLLYAVIGSLLLMVSFSGVLSAGNDTVVRDALGNDLEPDLKVEKVVCAGPGALRLLTYLQAHKMISGVEDIEKRNTPIDPRPYFLANPSFKNMPQIGEFRGLTRPELVVSLKDIPQVIFKTYPEMGTPAPKLQESTGIPVIPLEYGNLFNQKDKLFSSLRIMGQVVGKSNRAEAVITFIEETISDLSSRMEGIEEGSKKKAYVGGIAYKGPHGLRSTEKGYPPFMFTGTRNVAFAGEEFKGSSSHADVSREKILEWDPEVIFIDLTTLNAPPDASALAELVNDPLWKDLRAVKNGEIYGVLPYNWYTQNFGSILANAYFIGKMLYPDRFQDVDPDIKADQIFSFLVNKELFHVMKDSFKGMAFERLELK